MSFQLSPEQFCTIILYDWKIGLTYKTCHARLVQPWREQTPSDHTVFDCFREFRHNKLSVQDAPRSASPSTSVTQQTIDAVRQIIEEDPHST